jgi:hypothetical protein
VGILCTLWALNMDWFRKLGEIYEFMFPRVQINHEAKLRDIIYQSWQTLGHSAHQSSSSSSAPLPYACPEEVFPRIGSQSTANISSSPSDANSVGIGISATVSISPAGPVPWRKEFGYLLGFSFCSSSVRNQDIWSVCASSYVSKGNAPISKSKTAKENHPPFIILKKILNSLYTIHMLGNLIDYMLKGLNLPPRP